VSLTRTESGAAGEAYVAGRLARDGYVLLDRNWRIRGGELDIVALDGEMLVFIEVKVRTGERAGRAEDSVAASKLTALYGAAQQYLVRHPQHRERVWRVDLVAVTLDRDRSIRRYQHYQNLTLD
jgi:putative endonuclease